MDKTIVVHSGGLDSTVLLYHFAAQCPVESFAVNYGQRHAVELGYADRLSRKLGIKHHAADLNSLRPFLAGSSQTSDVDVPEAHYADPSQKATIVPNRNMILLSVAAAHAISQKATTLAFGAHGGDAAIYADCRPSFVKTLGHALKLVTGFNLELAAPFLDLNKADIVALGQELGVPFAETWSCYKGGTKHCGLCGACFERREAFQKSGVTDPTEYE